MEAKNLLILGAVGVGAYLVWANALPGGSSPAYDPIAQLKALGFKVTAVREYPGVYELAANGYIPSDDGIRKFMEILKIVGWDYDGKFIGPKDALSSMLTSPAVPVSTSIKDSQPSGSTVTQQQNAVAVNAVPKWDTANTELDRRIRAASDANYRGADSDRLNFDQWNWYAEQGGKSPISWETLQAFLSKGAPGELGDRINAGMSRGAERLSAGDYHTIRGAIAAAGLSGLRRGLGVIRPYDLSGRMYLPGTPNRIYSQFNAGPFATKSELDAVRFIR